MKKKIVIVKDRRLPFYSHQIDHYATRWSHMGHYVSFSYDGNGLSDADIVAVCIDKTQVPKKWIHKIMNTKATILNFSTLDISKRHFSKLILDKHSQYSGKVIVKTNRNAHGGPEMIEDVVMNNARRFDLEQVTERELIENKGKLFIQTYLVYKSANEVPLFFWDSPDLIIEKFIDKPSHNKYYRVYFYSFFGDRGICGYIDSKHQIVRWENSELVKYIQPIPIVHQWQKELKIDFGRFDFLYNDGEWMLIDVNKTEGSSSGYLDIGTYDSEFSYLSEGIKKYL